MKGGRARKEKAGSYEEGLYLIESCIGGGWRVVDDCFVVERDFESLSEARQWCRAHPADPEYAGKHIMTP